MQQNGEKDEILCALVSVEDLAEKKAKIYSRLLTETTLAQAMETLANRHAKRKQTLKKLLTGKTEADE